MHFDAGNYFKYCLLDSRFQQAENAMEKAKMESIRKTFTSYLKNEAKSEPSEQRLTEALNVDPATTSGVKEAFKALKSFNASALAKIVDSAVKEYEEVFEGKGMVKVTKVSKAYIVQEYCQTLGNVLVLLEQSLLGLKNGELDGSFLGDTLKDNQKKLLKATEEFRKKAAKI